MAGLEWTAYDALGLPPTATQEEIKAAWKIKAKQLHPDAGGSAELFDRARRAYDELTTQPKTKTPTPPTAHRAQQPAAPNRFTPPPQGSTATQRTQRAREQAAEQRRQGREAVYNTVLKNARAAGVGKLRSRRLASVARHTFERRLDNPNYTWIDLSTRFSIYLIALSLSSLATYLRLSGLLYKALGVKYGQKILLTSAWYRKPTINEYPMHLTGIVISNLLVGLLLGTIWIARIRRGRFNRVSQALLGAFIASIVIAGEFIMTDWRVLLVLPCVVIYPFIAGRPEVLIPSKLRKGR